MTAERAILSIARTRDAVRVLAGVLPTDAIEGAAEELRFHIDRLATQVNPDVPEERDHLREVRAGYAHALDVLERLKLGLKVSGGDMNEAVKWLGVLERYQKGRQERERGRTREPATGAGAFIDSEEGA